MLLGQGLGYALRLAYFIVVARLLGVVNYGVVVGAFALVNLVSPYSSLGAGRVLIRYVSANHKLFSQFWANLLVVTVATSGVVMLVLHLVAPHVLDAASAAVVVTSAVAVCFCEQLTTGTTQVFQAFQDMRTAATLNQLTSLLRTLTALGLLVGFHRVTAAQWCLALMFSSIAAAAIGVATVTVKFGAPAFSFNVIRKHFGEGVEFAFGASTTSAYNDLDKAMLSHYAMDAANGIYSMAYRILDVAYVPIIAIQMAAEPRLFQLAGTNAHEALALGKRLLKKCVLVSLSVAVGLFVFAPLIPYVVGKGFGEGVSALRWLALIPAFRSVHAISGSALTSVGKQRYRTVTQLIAVALNFGLNLWLIPHYEWRGAAYASLATDGSLAAMNFSLFRLLQRKSRSSIDVDKEMQLTGAVATPAAPALSVD
jgi:O-antigen/teichoic acid export membrane protein